MSNINQLEIEKSEFKPSVVWHQDELDAEIERAQHEMNGKEPKALIDTLVKKVESSKDGISFAILKGEHPEEYSDAEALVMFNPFANTASPNMLVRAEFIREVAKQADIRATDGKLKPVVMLASPGRQGSKLGLDREDKKLIAGGDLGPVARELLRAVSEREIGQVALLGFSQGADVALAGARVGYSANLDTTAISVGDPAGVKDRNLAVLGKDFFAAAPDLEAAADRSGLDVLRPARGGIGEYAKFVASASKPINWLTIGKALGKNSFEYRVQEILDEGKIEDIVIGYGSASTITPPEAIEPSLERLHDADQRGLLTSVRVEGAQHTWGDQLTLLAKLYMRAIK